MTGLLIGLGTFDLFGKLSKPEYFIPYFGGISSLIFSMVASLIAVRIIKYNIEPKIQDLERFFDNLDSEYFKYVTIIRQSIRPFIDAIIDIKKINNRKVTWITASWIALVIGLVLIIIYTAIFVTTNYKQDSESKTEITPSAQTILKLFPGVEKDVLSRIFPRIDTPGDGAKINEYNTIPYGQINTSQPWLDIKYQWVDENLTVYVVVRSDSEDEKQAIVSKAINKWSSALKRAGHNSSAWDIDVAYLDDSNVTKYEDQGDIVVVLLDERNSNNCYSSYGYSELFHKDDDPQYAIVHTSCGDRKFTNDEIYSTVMHEFGHTLGLGHAFNKDGDLMCSIEHTYGKTCTLLSQLYAEPSDLNLRTIFYMYGNDGFGSFNRVLIDKPYYIYSRNMTDK